MKFYWRMSCFSNRNTHTHFCIHSGHADCSEFCCFSNWKNDSFEWINYIVSFSYSKITKREHCIFQFVLWWGSRCMCWFQCFRNVVVYNLGIQRNVNIACSNVCCGDGPVACLYFDAFETLLWWLFCVYANHQALRFCMLVDNHHRFPTKWWSDRAT